MRAKKERGEEVEGGGRELGEWGVRKGWVIKRIKIQGGRERGEAGRKHFIGS